MKIVSINEAVSILEDGGILGIPTETVYGLAANGLNESAVKKVFEAKGRPSDNPLILHVNSMEMLKKIVKSVSVDSEVLINKYWPGPLTMVFDKSSIVPNIVTAGLDTVCVRMPRQKITLELIKKLGFPLAAPSANKSGRPSPTDIKMLEKEMPDIAALDGGVTELGIESTVIDVRGDVPVLYRLGSLSVEVIEEALGKKLVTSKEIKSPGQLYKHYSPHGDIVLFNSNHNINDNPFNNARNTNFGIICSTTMVRKYRKMDILDLGINAKEHAKNLFQLLHRTEELGWKKIFVDLADVDTGSGLANTVVERLRRAAASSI